MADVQPTKLVNPATALRRQRANCFELSTILVSLLIGAGYDAYVVSGYAGQTTCDGDLSFDECPLLATVPPTTPSPAKPTCVKYKARPGRQLLSRYEKMMAAREQDEIRKRHESEIAQELAEREASSHYVTEISHLYSLRDF